MDIKTPQEIRFTRRITMSKTEYENDPHRFEYLYGDKLREELAHHIQKEKATIIEDDFRIERQLDIYAASPQEFWEIVQREAERIALQFMR